MKYLKYIILLVFVIIILLIIAISVISYNNQKFNNENNINDLNNTDNTINNSVYNNSINDSTSNNMVNLIEDTSTPRDKELEYDGNIQELTSKNMFYAIENAIQNYINNIVDNNSLAVYNQLSASYISNNGINSSNVLNYVNKASIKQSFRALEIKYVQGQENNTYGIYGKLLNNDNESNVYFVINVNMNNFCYTITPKLDRQYADLSEININIDNQQIIENSDNKLQYSAVTDEQEIKKIMRDYKMNALYDTQSAYNSLDSQYSEERFKDYSDYTKYVQNNINKIRDLSLVSYNKEEKIGYTEYTCIDIYDNYYTIKLNGIMDYTIILDDYILSKTSDYTNLSDVQKVKYNIRKVIKMLNTCDYTHLYEHLNNSFKTNNFATQEQFEEYVKQNLFEYNVISSIDVIEGEGNTYTAKVEIKNKNSVAANVITKNIIMNLGTGTDFKISFDI